MPPESLRFCDDESLGYQRSRTLFAPGAGFALDESYCLAHLPLVAPGHPRAILQKPGSHYENGRHPEIFSLVLPVPAAALEASPAYRALEGALKSAPFAKKIAWDIVAARREKLHATVCGSLGIGEAPNLAPEARAALARIGPFRVALRGLFSGNVNRGRLYLRAYPECRDGQNPLQATQKALGRPVTDLYVVGLWNLADDLAPDEATALASLIDAWWERPILEFLAESLWLMGAHDDLVLESRLVETVPLAP